MKHNSLIRHPGFSSEYRNWTVWLLAVFIAFAMCGAAQAQPTKKHVRIGFLAQVSSSAISARIDAFRQGMRDLGYVEGQNLKIDYRFTGESAERTRAAAAELVASAPDVLFVSTNPAVSALLRETHTIPIVFITGLVDRSVRPRLLARGAVECLSKPFSEAALLDAVRAALHLPYSGPVTAP